MKSSPTIKQGFHARALATYLALHGLLDPDGGLEDVDVVGRVVQVPGVLGLDQGVRLEIESCDNSCRRRRANALAGYSDSDMIYRVQSESIQVGTCRTHAPKFVPPPLSAFQRSGFVSELALTNTGVARNNLPFPHKYRVSDSESRRFHRGGINAYLEVLDTIRGQAMEVRESRNAA